MIKNKDNNGKNAQDAKEEPVAVQNKWPDYQHLYGLTQLNKNIIYGLLIVVFMLSIMIGYIYQQNQQLSYQLTLVDNKFGEYQDKTENRLHNVEKRTRSVEESVTGMNVNINRFQESIVARIDKDFSEICVKMHDSQKDSNKKLTLLERVVFNISKDITAIGKNFQMPTNVTKSVSNPSNKDSSHSGKTEPHARVTVTEQ